LSRKVLALFLGLAAAVATPVAARPVLLPDSTTVDAWQLANGLKVRVRQVDGAPGASISLAYLAGTRALPDDRPGLARLLAELQFTAAAGEIPERTLDELAYLRPAGWDLRATDHVAVLTEVATRPQFPGVLLQVATRARGVQLSDSCLRNAVASVRRQMGQAVLGDPSLVLHFRLRGVAMGLDDAAQIDQATARDIGRLGRSDAAALLARYYVPANATLSLAGDFSGIDLHTVLAAQFGDIPAGAPATERPTPPLKAGTQTSRLPGLKAPLAAIGVLAPALEDTLHPTFYLAGLVMAGWWRDHEGAPRPPLGSSFRYYPLDEPDLLRYFQASVPAGATPAQVFEEWRLSVEGLRADAIGRDMLESTRDNIGWLIGGPMSREVRTLARRSPGPITTMSVGAGIRATWKGDAFWNLYLHRFLTTTVAPQRLLPWYQDPAHVTTLLLLPRP
jgi:hypothetical protein